MFRYQAYGLGIVVNRPLPGLPTARPPAPVDLYVDLQGLEPFQHPLTPVALLYSGPDRQTNGEPVVTLWRLSDAAQASYFRLGFADGGKSVEFTINAQATRVWATWTEDVLFQSVAALFLAQLPAAVLWLRGITCLHASVVALEGCAVALVGASGAGKSSTAAAFAERGAAVLADDLAALDDLGTRFLVQPGYPALSLWPHTAATLFGSIDLPRIWTKVDKRHLGLHSDAASTSFRFEERPLPLAAIYFLGRRSATDTPPSILRIAPAQGLLLLIANTYTRTRLSEAHRVREFERLSRVAMHVPLRQIDGPNNLASLPRVCEAIVNDVARRDKAPAASYVEDAALAGAHALPLQDA